MSTTEKKIAIVGCGPRGLSALESLYSELSKSTISTLVKTVVFERTGNFGNGQVYNCEQNSANWLNVAGREVAIEKRESFNYNQNEIPSFPSFQDWLNLEKTDKTKADYYPKRSELGTYLNERFTTLYEGLSKAGVIQKQQEEVIDIECKNNQVKLLTSQKNEYLADEVLLTIGHQNTETHEQIKRWTEYANKNDSTSFFQKPYPINEFLNGKIINAQSKIALRGFGLSMMDVVRAIAVESGGNFSHVNEPGDKMIYISGRNTPKKLIPFSLNGLPMHPKPFNEIVDSWFLPSKKQKNQLISQITKAKENIDKVQSPDFLVKAMAPIIAEVYLNLENHLYVDLKEVSIENLIVDWVLHDKNNELCMSPETPIKSQLEQYVLMASGKANITLDYCIGQVWRHFHPTLYQELSHTNFPPEIMADIIALDQKCKRLTFGPPVASLQQLIALMDAKILTVRVIDDPDIALTEKGWELDAEDTEITANIMINTVLDNPTLLEVKTPLIKNLVKKGILKSVHEKLGTKILKNAVAVSNNESEYKNISMLGRLTIGSVFGVDAISECFGNRQILWARGVVKRLSENKIKNK
ncbi:FAD/NAD(P)-binding protein [Tenacibaculum sp. IB213877]|uniref:FAD/NAD(P)-binding protein n=1 Tax=Tenacibaculum sp. IB213877 TaxID=3097351 RepID=UPI002A598731|nr:FAD/NAD(P)-binding protein [Tenacibaculum sp. IB213877]MDY0779335.1 FAD/NAD(P)-binding protein [Tenacibaculum sp. IB213877]